MDTSDLIALLALLVSALSAIYTIREGRKRRDGRVDDQVRAAALPELRHIDLGINSAHFALEFEEWEPEWEGLNSDLAALAPRMRRAQDRLATEQLARDRERVRAHWWDTKHAFDEWRQQWENELMGKEAPDDGRLSTEDLFKRFSDAHEAYIPRAEALRRDIRAIVARIDARNR